MNEELPIKIVFDPPYMTNKLEFLRSEDGTKILGWRWEGWKGPEGYESRL